MDEVDGGGTTGATLDCVVLFTDIVGSTPRWESTPDLMRSLLRLHDDLLTDVVEAHGGVVVKRTGDGLVARFDDVDAAVLGAVTIQRALPSAFDDQPDTLTVRMGVHAGRLEPRLGDLHGPAMNRGARIMSAAHGGQILVSERVRERCERDDVHFTALGIHRLKGLLHPERIHQVMAPGITSAFPPIRSLNESIGNLPLTPDTIVNRVAEIDQLARAVVDRRLISLVGPGGVGKTRLAVHCAHRARAHFPDGVWMVDLAAVNEAGRVAATAAGALALQPGATEDLASAVGRALTERSMLVVVDNCEHLHDEVVALVRRWSATSASTLLCTSQRRLGVPGELVVRVEPLDVPTTDDPPEVPPALQLFAQRAMLADPSFELDDTNRATVATICRELDGLPLAIELAAARCEVWSVDQIARRLDERLSLLRDRRETDRHQTLRAAIEWSYDLAAPAARSLLRTLSVFRSPFTFEAAAAVSGLDEVDVLDELTDLLDRSLLSRTGTRFRLLDTVRRFAALHLAASPDDEAAVRARHAEWMSGRAASATDDPDLGVVLAWLDELTPLAADLRLALDTLLTIRPDRAARMALDLMDLWITRSRYREALEWVTRCLDAIAEPVGRIELLGWASSLGWAAGDNIASAAWAQEAIDLAAAAGVGFPTVAGTRLAVHCAFAGRSDEALALVDRTTAALADDPVGAARLLGPLGVALAALGHPDRAVELADEGVARAERVGVLRLTTARMNRMMITPGRAELAETARSVAEVCARTGRAQGEGQALLYEAGCAQAEGRIADVLDKVVRSAGIFLVGSEWTSVVNTLDNLPKVLATIDPTATVELIAAVERLHDELGQTGAPAMVAVRARLRDQLRVSLGNHDFGAAWARGTGRSAADVVDRLRWLIDSGVAAGDQQLESPG